jgi:type IV pilus assembly protein PilB
MAYRIHTPRDSGLTPMPSPARPSSSVTLAPARSVPSSAYSTRVSPNTAHEADAPAVRLLNDILLDAAVRNASDLHIERGPHDWRIRLRIDGVLHPIDSPPSHLRDALLARIKALAGMDIAERRVPQDGRVSVRVQPDRSEDFRVSTLPTVHGEKVVLRRLETLPSKLDFDVLGFTLKQQASIRDAIQAPHGMVLVTGPTGSGKTMSLFCFLQAINDAGVNICTVEDPVEIRLPGLNQVSVHEKAGLGFAGVLRAFLRQDPDIMMVGEIRDAETADIAVKAAQTGHRVLSTLHTNDAPATIIRLRDIGVAPYKIASTLRLVTAQRLVRRLCPHCKKPDPLAAAAGEIRGTAAVSALGTGGTASMASAIGTAANDALATTTDGESTRAWRAVGCAACHGIGYSGRLAIHQVMPISDAMRDLVAGGASCASLTLQAANEGVLSLRDAAMARVLAGDTSLDEASAAVGKNG